MSSIRCSGISLIIILAISFGTAQAQTIIHVDDDATLGGDGASWATAYRYVQDALQAANAGDEVRVAGGIYKPDQEEDGSVTSGDREATFQLMSGVAIHGGYRGCLGGDCESGDPDERDIAMYETILSGDLAGDDADVASPEELFDEPTRAENTYHVVTGSGTDETAVLDGLTIVGGYANGSPIHHYGGGMYNERGSPTVTNCTLSENAANRRGGGMYNYDRSSPTLTGCAFLGNSADQDGGGIGNRDYSNPTFANCVFSGNTATYHGGAMDNYMSSPTLLSCAFSENSAGYEGGGMRNNNHSTPMLTDCTFLGNTTGLRGGGMYNYESDAIVTDCTFTRNTAGNDGGGVSNQFHSNSTVTDCIFRENLAGNGGGMHNYLSQPTLMNCTFLSNVAGGEGNEDGGGAMYNLRGGNPTVTNCMFSGNSSDWVGGAMVNYGSTPALTNCTFSGNSARECGGGVFNAGPGGPTLANCVLWDNLPDEIGPDGYPMPIVMNSNVQGGTGEAWFGEGCIDTDPLFVFPGHWDDGGTQDDPGDAAWVDGDYRLQAGSPCIDTGDDAAVTVSIDLDGNPRIIDGDGDGVATVDMGAYEFQETIVVAARLDIKPGSCPNPVNPRGQGVVPMALVGDESFDVAEVDVDSLVLRRTDGVGEAVVPITRRGRPRVAIEDVGTPFAGEHCDCHEMGGDGIDDLAIKFSTPEMVAAFDLDDMPRRGSVALTLTGALFDGTVFEATDCVVITGQPGRALNGRRLGRGHRKP